MNPKEISRPASAIFRSSIPTSWAVRDQQDQEDYGVDYEIEPMRPNDTATGFLFKIQQKGSESAESDSSGCFVKLAQVSTSKLRYYLSLKVPVILVCVDVTERVTYWTPVHGNQHVIQKLAEAEKNNWKTITLLLPKENVLPKTAERLLEAVSSIVDFLIARGIAEIGSDRLLKTVRGN